MALRPAPKRNPVDYQKLDDLQKQIFGSQNSEKQGSDAPEQSESKSLGESSEIKRSEKKTRSKTVSRKKESESEQILESAKTALSDENSPSFNPDSSKKDLTSANDFNFLDSRLKDLETIAANIVSSKAGQGRHTTRPFSLPRTLIIDTTRLKSKFRTIDEQFTQNVIVDFLLREALKAATPENYKELRAAAFETVKRADETTRRSLTVTEEVIYQMSELKAGINLETGKKYSNDEIFSTLLAIGVSWLYHNNVLA